MAALKEIKSRIGSVNNTLKITSAMKMVASAKLHRVQGAAEGLAAYSSRLQRMVAAIGHNSAVSVVSPLMSAHSEPQHATLVVVASDASLCGAFNSNMIREMERRIATLRAEGFRQIDIFSIGAKVQQAATKRGLDSSADFSDLAGAPVYPLTAALADRLMQLYTDGATDLVEVIYSHNRSMSRQEPQTAQLLPFALNTAAAEGTHDTEYILEPAAGELLKSLVPYAVRTYLYEMLLDGATAEHAARTVAMQTATDNAHDLLEELTLTYNKRRQQAITDELADITQND